MSVNLKPQMSAINTWLIDATKQLLDANIPSAKLDAEILLAHSTNKTRTNLHAHPEQIICSKDLELANSYLRLRINRMPVAYIIGHKEFYGRNFTVTSATLIPRPESEQIIYFLKDIVEKAPTAKLSLVDVGTGSGCLGITAKLEIPSLGVTLADISKKAIDIARLNSKALGAPVNIVQSDLFTELHNKYDIIIANLPYVDKIWDCSPETKFEPSLAIFADDCGESIIKRLIDAVPDHLSEDGYLIIEADPRQHKELIDYAKDKSLTKIAKEDYAIVFKFKN